MAEMPYFGPAAGSMSPVLGDARRADNTVATRLTNYRALIARATDVFGDEIKASRWLSTPNADLAGRVPLEMASLQDYKFSFLEPIFIRIEHGIDY
jgi:uncharacterized protein (DUF2384 family)